MILFKGSHFSTSFPSRILLAVHHLKGHISSFCQGLALISYFYPSVDFLYPSFLPPLPLSLSPSLTDFRNDFRLCHFFTHPPIVPFSCFPKRGLFSPLPYPSFFPCMLSLTPFELFSPSSNPLCPLFHSSPHISQFLCTSRISPNVLLRTPSPFITRSIPL